MSESSPFNPPEVTDGDIRWVSSLLNLRSDAFCGKDGKDPRKTVLKSMEPMDVAACPGSGKTTLLVAKLAILAEKWRYRTRGVCVLSHTNAAREEIETKLGGTMGGRRLLSYPHYIGTIHGFVNEFLARPWLRSHGYRVKMINTEICLNRRWNSLPVATRRALETNGHDSSILTVKSTDFGVGVVPWGGKRTPLSTNSPTYSNIQGVCCASARDGYFCHDEMFVWATELIDKAAVAAEALRGRFPLLFIDEAQDNNEEQSAILHRIFMDGGSTVRRQRFGDANQAIYNFVGDEGATTDVFPGERIQALPNSHRFGQKIAEVADPLAVVPCGLKGQGPKAALDSGAQEGFHTIFLFDDNSIVKVLGRYGELLIKTFSSAELNEGSRKGMFVAVGQVHKGKDDRHMPRHVGHYWPGYDPELVNKDPKPQTFIEYVFAGLAEAERVGQSYPAVEKIAEGILRLAGMTASGRALHDRRYRHRYVLRLLEGRTKLRQRYCEVLDRFAVRKEPPTETMWNGDRPAIVKKIAEAVVGTSLSGDEVQAFLAWPTGSKNSESTITAQKSRDNVYRHPSDSPRVHIRVGSIHSIKGQTHTATLVLETFWQDHNLRKLMQWIVGAKGEKGWRRSDGVEQRKRLKIHYVAMTRPTHLLCLAMKRSSFEEADGTLDQEKVEQLRKRRGWHVEFV
jgi:hypothetical protein